MLVGGAGVSTFLEGDRDPEDCDFCEECPPGDAWILTKFRLRELTPARVPGLGFCFLAFGGLPLRFVTGADEDAGRRMTLGGGTTPWFVDAATA